MEQIGEISYVTYYVDTPLGGNSQKQSLKIFVTLDLKILDFKTNSIFLKQISLKVDVNY